MALSPIELESKESGPIVGRSCAENVGWAIAGPLLAQVAQIAPPNARRQRSHAAFNSNASFLGIRSRPGTPQLPGSALQTDTKKAEAEPPQAETHCATSARTADIPGMSQVCSSLAHLGSTQGLQQPLPVALNLGWTNAVDQKEVVQALWT